MEAHLSELEDDFHSILMIYDVNIKYIDCVVFFFLFTSLARLRAFFGPIKLFLNFNGGVL